MPVDNGIVLIELYRLFFPGDLRVRNTHLSLWAQDMVYYNLEKRAGKGISTEGNLRNFLSLKTGIHPNWFVISNQDNLQVISDISIIPSWGNRHHIGSHFNYEAGVLA